jgi:quercetin dioxygenase-like cupin family protein
MTKTILLKHPLKEKIRMTLPIKEIVLAAGQGHRLTVGNSEVIFKAVGSDTHGHLGLFENVIQPGGTAPALHIHKQMEEMFYVLEGEVEIKVGNQTIQGQPGAFVLVPRSTPHTFANLGTKPAKLLIMFTPGGEREKYFEGLAELLKDGKKPDREALLELMRQFDQEPVEM